VSQVGLIAEFQVNLEDMDLFLEAARRELASVRSSEPGCLRFDVVLFDEQPGHGAFVEVFEDDAAAKTHRETEHFAAFFNDISEIEVTWSARRGHALTVE